MHFSFFFFFFCCRILQSAVVVYQSLQRPRLGLCRICVWWMPRLLSCAVFYPKLCWRMLRCAILYSFSAPLCCANMDWPIGYGWQGTVWADRCLGQSCWAGLVLTGGPGWMDPCSRASRGGGPKSRLNPGSETVMRGTMCQDWQNSSTTRYPHQYPALLISPCLFSLLFFFFASLLPLTP